MTQDTSRSVHSRTRPAVRAAVRASVRVSVARTVRSVAWRALLAGTPFMTLPAVSMAQAATRDATRDTTRDATRESARDSTPRWARSSIAFAERRYEAARRLRDQIDVTRAMGADTSAHGVPLDSLEAWYHAATDSLAVVRTLIPPRALVPAERRVLFDLYDASAKHLTRLPPRIAAVMPHAPNCAYDPASILATEHGIDSLSARILACYGRAARSIPFGPDTLDRLSVLGRLANEADPMEGEGLWSALEPVWRSVNGANDSRSPWRALIAEHARSWKSDSLPVNARANALGLTAAEVERWLVRALDAWRRATPDTLIEPWDWYYLNGAVSRAIADRVPREQLRPIVERYYASLGADLGALNVQFDIDPRPTKRPVAYTTFGDRPRWTKAGWHPGEPTIVATYRVGGLDNLNEFMHEAGHAVHIAAIRTRPTYADWPDSDPFTEGLADIVALDLYEPRWQQRWLGARADTVSGLRGRYGGVMLDMAWALFEIRMHRSPALDPNVTWSEITSRYLHIKPHLDRSWWAMRAQLFDSPGYMLNYALGAFLIADVRATLRARHGDWVEGDTAWYARVRSSLYQHGSAVPARDVLRKFLGRPMRADALLADLARMRAPARPRTR